MERKLTATGREARGTARRTARMTASRAASGMGVTYLLLDNLLFASAELMTYH